MSTTNLLLTTAVTFALVACGTTQPVVKIVTQQVEVPIAVACKTETPVEPVFNFASITETNDIYDKTRALLADRALHLGYETELLAALKSCK